MRNCYFTIFNSTYLLQAITLSNSFYYHNKNSKLYLICLDEFSFNSLIEFNNTLIYVPNVIKKNILDLIELRSIGEQCWSLKSILFDYLMEYFDKEYEWFTYVDADGFFYSDPDEYFYKHNSYDCLLTPHSFKLNWPDKESIVGKFNAGFISIKNTVEGKNITNYWMDMCLQSCSHIPDEFTYADQKYLDYFEHIFPNRIGYFPFGYNVAPWNIDESKIKKQDNYIYSDKYKIVYYHFQGLRILNMTKVCAYTGNFIITDKLLECVYSEYISKLKITLRKYPYLKYLYKKKLSIKYLLKLFIYRTNIVSL